MRFVPALSADSALRSPRTRFSSPVLLFLGLSVLSGCEDKNKQAAEETSISAEDKKERLDALLKENGLDPNSIPKADTPSLTPEAAPPKSAGEASPQSAPGIDEQGSTPASATSASAQSNESPPAPEASAASGDPGPAIAVQLLSKGKAPYQTLRYGFKQGNQRKFSLDIEVAVQRLVQGQSVPTMPPFALALKGSTTTIAANQDMAQRQHTFENLVPNVPGAPPEVATQFAQQYSSLKGIKLLETVSTRGIMMGMQLEEQAVHPQVLALMQHLQDGMTNAFLPLPEVPVGAGARWVGSTTIDAAGIELIQENEITLTSLKGKSAEAEIKLRQHAKSSQIAGANLPPGVTIDLIKLEGTGKAKMKVDFEEITVDAQVELETSMETSMMQPGAPAPVKEAANTSMKSHIQITK